MPDLSKAEPDDEVRNNPPNYRCAFCGEGVVCEHGKCNVCQHCRECD